MTPSSGEYATALNVYNISVKCARVRVQTASATVLFFVVPRYYARTYEFEENILFGHMYTIIKCVLW